MAYIMTSKSNPERRKREELAQKSYEINRTILEAQDRELEKAKKAEGRVWNDTMEDILQGKYATK